MNHLNRPLNRADVADCDHPPTERQHLASRIGPVEACLRCGARRRPAAGPGSGWSPWQRPDRRQTRIAIQVPYVHELEPKTWQEEADRVGISLGELAAKALVEYCERIRRAPKTWQEEADRVGISLGELAARALDDYCDPRHGRAAHKNGRPKK